MKHPDFGVYRKKEDTGSHGFIRSLIFIFPVCLILSFLRFSAGAQEIWGVADEQGLYNAGTIFKTDADGENFSVVYDFPRIEGKYPRGNLVEAPNGKFYGMTFNGGKFDLGVLFEFDPGTGTYTKKIDFSGGENGSQPYGSLTVYGTKLYGMTWSGGIYDWGVIFEFNPEDGELVKKIDFDNGIMGGHPIGNFTVMGSKLYGMASAGGSNYYGTLFEFDPITGGFNKKFDFDGTGNGREPHGFLTIKDNILYGTTYLGGANDLGVIFKFNPADNTFNKLFDFDTGNNGNPYGLTLLNGIFYGIASGDQWGNYGMIFSFNPTDNSLSILFYFSYPDGTNSSGSLTVCNGKLYGMTSWGGATYYGTLFEFNPTNNNFVVKVNLSGITGGSPLGNSLMLSGGKLWGMTNIAGPLDKGTLFSYDPVNNIFEKKLDFNSPVNGGRPAGKLIEYGGKFFGTTKEGGLHNAGTMFEIDPSGPVVTKKIDFNGSGNGSNPAGYLTEVNGKLYGLTTAGVDYNMGFLFEYDPVSGTIIRTFNLYSSVSGLSATGGLTLFGENLYGMTSGGGDNGGGVIFEFDPGMGTISSKYTFDNYQGLNGSTPQGSLTAYGGKLYGTTYYGGSTNEGVIFEFDPSGGGTYTKKADLTGNTGNYTFTSLTLSGDKLYGMAPYGGTYGVGAIFVYDPSGAGIITRKIDFDGSEKGSYPFGDLSSVGGKLVGMTKEGGLNGLGTLFIYDPVGETFSKTKDFNQDTGGKPTGSLCVSGDISAPVARCKDITLELGTSGQVTLDPTRVDNGSTPLTGLTLTVNPGSFDCTDSGADTVTLTATNSLGESTCTATVTVKDLLPPVVQTKDLTIQLDVSGTTSIATSDVNNGSTENCTIQSMTVAPSAFTCANLGTNTVTLTVTDQSGNAASKTASVTVQDLLPPVVQTKDITVQLNASGTASIFADDVNNGSTDNCTIQSMTVAPSAFTCANLGTNTVTLTVTDQSGNAASKTATVTVIDLIVPSVTCPVSPINVTVSPGETHLHSGAGWDPVATDNCGTVTVQFLLSGATTGSGTTLDGVVFNVGSTGVSWTVKDGSNNSVTCSLTVNVTEATAGPVARCKDITVYLDAAGSVTITPEDVNNGSANGVLSLDKTSFTCSDAGANSVILIVTGSGGATATCTGTVTVVDNLPPEIICRNAVVNLDASGTAAITAVDVNNGSTDNCTIQSMVVAPSVFTCANLGTNTVTLTVTDQNGNESSKTATVIVQDLIVPSVTCPVSPINVTVNPGETYLHSGTGWDPVVSDNCGVTSAHCSLSGATTGSGTSLDGVAFNAGITTADWTITDGSGNTAGCSFIVNVIANYTIIFPEIILDTAFISAGQSIVITGKDFTPNGTASININGPAGFSPFTANFSTTFQGGFSYIYTSLSSMPSGFYAIIASDTVSGLTAPTRQFFLESFTPPVNYLQITSPLTPITVNTNEIILVEFKDRMALGNSYPITGSKRDYRYLAELSGDNGLSWEMEKTIEGQDYIDSQVELNFSASIATPGNQYIIRITDFYNSSHSVMTPEITVIEPTQTGNLKVDLNWDFSFPQPSCPVEGIAAEGTARIFLHLSKIDTTLGPDISSVEVNLGDDFNGNDPGKLGKVKVAAKTSSYNLEANLAASVSAKNDTAGKNHYIFWYVAPDDFAGADPRDQKNSFRTVTATFLVNYVNSTVETITKSIRIVRPPLMFVHDLSGDASSWDNFRHDRLGYEMKFRDDPRFKTCVPVTIFPSAYFRKNAQEMTVGNSNPGINTFQGVINDMRNKGYAANRVDYVGHGMGGCVLRSVYDNYYGYFTRTGNGAKRLFKNYEKGYVNKAILIGTPHNSTSWADLVNRYAGDLPQMVRDYVQSWYRASGTDLPIPLLFMEPASRQPVPKLKPTDAVRDLQIDDANGGVNFGVTNIKSHLISGDFLPGRQDMTTRMMLREIANLVKNSGDEVLQKVLYYFLQIATNKETDPELRKELSGILGSKTEPVEKALAFLDKMDKVLDVYNPGTFLPESDLMVSVRSQLAGYPRPVSNGDTNVSVFDGYVSHACFRKELDNADIGNRVSDLLNSDINSALFDTIPATPEFLLKNTKSEPNDNPIISKTDTAKLQIILPLNGMTAYVDSSLHIKFIVRDTTYLKTAELNFQNKTYVTDSLFPGITDVDLQVNGNLLDMQEVTLEGFYNYPDSGVFVYDRKMVNIQTNDVLKGFGVNPQILYLYKNQIRYADYFAIYHSFITAAGSFSPGINVHVKDTAIVKHDTVTGGFMGMESGETSAIISYQGFSDTIFFVVDENGINNLQHFTPVWTGNGIDHMVINVFSAKLDGIDLEAGDEIAVFDGSLCVGAGIVDGTLSLTSTLDIEVSRDDGSGNGYTPGNPVTFTIFDKSKNLEISNVTASYSDLDTTWSTDGLFATGAVAFTELNGISSVSQLIGFTKGWNIFSANIIPDEPDMKTLFQTLIDDGSLVKIQDEAGNSLEDYGFFGGWQNNIGDMNPAEGYKIKVNGECQVTFSGIPVSLPREISLRKGWNIIGYPNQAEAEAKAVVQQLIDRGTLIKVQDENGNSIEDYGYFGGWQNNIGNFRPGEGYKIKVASDEVLTIYASYTKLSALPVTSGANVHFHPVGEGKGVDHMNVNLVLLPVSLFQPGDEIAVFDNNFCVGAVTLLQQHLEDQRISIPVTATDGTGDPGFTEGNRILLKVWKSSTQTEHQAEPEVIKGACSFVKHESTMISLKKLVVTGSPGKPHSSAPEVKIYPNPTDGKVYIQVNSISISVIHIRVINAIGQQVLYQVMDTSPQMIDLSGKVKGIYTVRIVSDTWSETEKVVLRQ